MEIDGVTLQQLTDRNALTPRQRAEATAHQFEAIFTQQMVQVMRQATGTLGEEGMFGSGPGSGTYEDWFDQNMARSLSDGGRLGIAEAMLRDWERYGAIPTADQEAAANGAVRVASALAGLRQVQAIALPGGGAS
jgi:flagellar protein FlgJ